MGPKYTSRGRGLNTRDSEGEREVCHLTVLSPTGPKWSLFCLIAQGPGD